VAQKRSVHNLNNKLRQPQKGYDIRCQLVLITSRKSRTGFRLISTLMTLNDLERRNSPYFAFFSPNSMALLANYVTVIED